MRSNNKKKIIITGSCGCIGTILKQGLDDFFDLHLIDLKEEAGKKSYVLDISFQFNEMAEIFRGKETVVHLAWNFYEDFPKETIDQNNKIMAENVYRTAIETGIKRVVIASSVHANDYSNAKERETVSPLDSWPDSPYGASKVYIESLGQYYSRYHGLEVICVRFGGVNPENRVIFEEDINYDKVLLYKEDCVDLIRVCLEAESVPGRFQTLTAVSNNSGRVHSLNNFLDWQPKFPKI